MDKQLDGLPDRIVEIDNPTVIAADETKIAKLEQDKLMLTDKLDQKTQSKLSLEDIFKISALVLTSHWTIWGKGGLTFKKTMLRTSFKAPLAYSKENGFRIPQTSIIFRFLGDFTEEYEMVRSGGLEPPRVLPHSDLNAARLPIPPRPQFIRLVSLAVIDDPVCDAKRGIRLLGILSAPRYPSAWLNGSSQTG